MRKSSLNISIMVLPVIHRVTRSRLYKAYPVVASLRSLSSTKKLQPLRILFCGSDTFSCASLRAVHQESRRDPNSIASIDVLVRPGKLSGRGLKSIREVPIKSVARELGLPVHEKDTFMGWKLPQPNGQPINLIIAVSFGLFVPPRILKSAEYGGINVHPSLLPDFRGPAPLHHTLLAGETRTGVTLQTLHPAKFDHGTILAQTPPLEIPNASRCTYQELLAFVTPKAADILVQGIRNRLFILEPGQPERNQDSNLSSSTEAISFLKHAPKITTEDRQIDWTGWSVKDILRHERVLSRLWTSCQPKGRATSRLILEGLEDMTRKAPKFKWYSKLNELAKSTHFKPNWELSNGQKPHDIQECGKVFLLPMIAANEEALVIPCVMEGESIVMSLYNGELLLVREITMEGSNKKRAANVLADLARSGEIEEIEL